MLFHALASNTDRAARPPPAIIKGDAGRPASAATSKPLHNQSDIRITWHRINLAYWRHSGGGRLLASQRNLRKRLS